jgi:hypothetical protein
MAKPQHHGLEVKVMDRVLWIGSDAYPVNNIARAQTRRLVPTKDKSSVGAFFKTVLTWFGLAIVATIIAAMAHHTSGDKVIWAAALVIFIIALIRLIMNLRKKQPDYYALVIETSGASRTALVTDNRGVVDTIVNQIMRAINGEMVRWSQIVNNFYGDTINQMGGSNNIGKIGV